MQLSLFLYKSSECGEKSHYVEFQAYGPETVTMQIYGHDGTDGDPAVDIILGKDQLKSLIRALRFMQKDVRS